MLVDTLEATFKAGKGGAGKISFRRNRKGPDGGNGGRGGDLYIRAVSNIFLLNQIAKDTVFEAENGEPGGENRKTGHGGSDLEVQLPVGSSVYDKQRKQVVADLTEVDQKILLCKGGRGGLGNWEFREEVGTDYTTTQPSEKGQSIEAIVTLKLIADFGLIGLPNAGKSSILNELTNANAKTANYAFTTIEPNLGVLNGKVLADIPGLIEGASEGKGLGIDFLKHIEKVKVILHCISLESPDVVKDYETVRGELGKFNKALLDKREIILLTKADLVDKSDLDSKFQILDSKGLTVFPISIHDFESVEKLKREITSLS